jgi:hypothetical protein
MSLCRENNFQSRLKFDSLSSAMLAQLGGCGLILTLNYPINLSLRQTHLLIIQIDLLISFDTMYILRLKNHC